jgi:GNAT superfamily N-acetyltransferase
MSSLIRPLAPAEYPLMVPMGQRFHAEMQLPGAFIPEVFLKNWQAYTASGFTAVVLSLWKGPVLAGGFGAMLCPDLLDGRLTATEFFWFMDPEHRFGMGAIRLIRAFEAWAAEHGAVEARIAHLARHNAEQLQRIYTKLGYAPLDVSYVKALSPITSH